MQPESPAVTQEIWNHLLDISRMHRYTVALEGRYRRRRAYFRVAVYLGALGTVGSIIGQIGELPISLSALEVAAVTTLDQVLDPSQKVARLHQARMEIHRIEQKYRDLWLDVHRSTSQVHPDEVLSQSRSLLQECRSYYMLIDVFDTKLDEKCAREADKVESERYADQLAETTS